MIPANSTRILTTHVGSLPRSEAVTRMVFAREHGEPVENVDFDRVIGEAVTEVVRRQTAAGIDLVSDGEMSKISYATYIKDRLTGFEGDSPRTPPADLEDFPGFLERQASGGGTPTYRRPRCTGEIRVRSMDPLEQDLKRFGTACAEASPTGAFINAASPGVIALFQPDEYYCDHDRYLEALAEAMRPEYERIVEAGFDLQLDSPDLGLGRHMAFKNETDEAYLALAARHVEVLNHALRNIPRERIRLHVCWGNYEGPHHRDAPLELVLRAAFRARIGALLFESSNPRHAHEWEVFGRIEVPEELVLVPGVIDSTTNFIEHPELVAQRLCRFADLVGRERVIAGSDCGFSTFAGFGAVDPDIVYAKLQTMAEGAAIASDRLWGRAA